MKILLYSLIFAPDVCSNAYVFSDLAKELIRQGHEVIVITTTPHYDAVNSQSKKKALTIGKKTWYRKSIYEGAIVYHIDVAPRKGGILQRVSNFYRFHKHTFPLLKYEHIEADVVMAQTPPPFIGLDCSKLAAKLGAKSVLVLQDLWIDSMIRKGKVRGHIKNILLWLENKQYQRVDSVCTISDVMADSLRNKMGATKKINVISNFVDTTLYHPIENSSDLRKKYNLSSDDFIVSYVGNIGNAQDLTPIIECAKHNKKIKFLIAGNGVKEEYFRELANGIDTITFLGFIDREKTLEINAISDICLVMLAQHVTKTSFPSKIYTIMAMKRPILISCADGCAASDFILNNQIGWRADVSNCQEFENTISELMGSKDQIIKCGCKAYRLAVTEYSERAITNKYCELFQSLMK